MSTSLSMEMYKTAVDVFTRRIDSTVHDSSSLSSVYFPPVSVMFSSAGSSRIVTRQESEKKTNTSSWHTIERISSEVLKQSNKLRDVHNAQSHAVIECLRNGESFVDALAKASIVVHGSYTDNTPPVSVGCSNSVPTQSPLVTPSPAAIHVNISPVPTLVTQSIVCTPKTIGEQSPLIQPDTENVKKEEKELISSYFSSNSTLDSKVDKKTIMVNFFGKKALNNTNTKSPTVNLTVPELIPNRQVTDTVASLKRVRDECEGEESSARQQKEAHIDKDVLYVTDSLPPTSTKASRVMLSNSEEVTLKVPGVTEACTVATTDTIVVHDEKEEEREKNTVLCSTPSIPKVSHYSSLNDDLVVHHEVDITPNAPVRDCFETMMLGNYNSETHVGSGPIRKKLSSASSESTNKSNVLTKYFNPELVAFQKQFEKRTKSVVKELPNGEYEFKELAYRVMVRHEQGGVVEEELTEEEYNQKCEAFITMVNSKQISHNTTATVPYSPQTVQSDTNNTVVVRVDESNGHACEPPVRTNGKRNTDWRKGMTIDTPKNTIHGMWSNKNSKSIPS